MFLSGISIADWEQMSRPICYRRLSGVFPTSNKKRILIDVTSGCDSTTTFARMSKVIYTAFVVTGRSRWDSDFWICHFRFLSKIRFHFHRSIVAYRGGNVKGILNIFCDGIPGDIRGDCVNFHWEIFLSFNGGGLSASISDVSRGPMGGPPPAHADDYSLGGLGGSAQTVPDFYDPQTFQEDNRKSESSRRL